MIQMQILRNMLYRICPVRKSKIGQLVPVHAKDKEPCVGKHIFKEQRRNIAEVPISPYPHLIPPAMGNTVKSGQGMYTDTDYLGKGGNGLVDALRHPHKSVWTNLHILLHKAVKSTGPETAGTKIILRYDLILLHRGIRNHHYLLPRFKCPSGIHYYSAHRFMDQRHRQFLFQHPCLPQALIIALIRITD